MALFGDVFLFQNYQGALEYVEILSFSSSENMPSEKVFLNILYVSRDKANLLQLSIQQHLGEEFHEKFLKILFKL